MSTVISLLSKTIQDMLDVISVVDPGYTKTRGQMLSEMNRSKSSHQNHHLKVRSLCQLIVESCKVYHIVTFVRSSLSCFVNCFANSISFLLMLGHFHFYLIFGDELNKF